jgi:hypothetical protein
MHIVFFVKGTAAFETYCDNPVMKIIILFSVLRVLEHWWNEIERGKPKY